MGPCVLIIDYEQRADMIKKSLNPAYSEITAVSSVQAAIGSLMLRSFDVAALNGTMEWAHLVLSFLFNLRRAKNTLLLLYPISSANTRADFLKRGFDMCLAEDSPAECAAAISALLRWPGTGVLRDGERPPGLVIFHDLTLDPQRQLVTMRGQSVDLTTAEFRLLYLLASNPGMLFSRERIYERVWGECSEYGIMGINNVISSIRQKLGLSPKDKEYIRAIHGAGYRFGM